MEISATLRSLGAPCQMLDIEFNICAWMNESGREDVLMVKLVFGELPSDGTRALNFTTSVCVQ